MAAYAAADIAALGVVTHLRGRTALEDYRGLVRTRPFAAVTLILAFLSLVGIPPLAGFVGKLALFLSAIDGEMAWVALLAIANSVLSLVYYLRIAAPMAFGQSENAVETLGGSAAAATAIAAALLVVLAAAAGLLWGGAPAALLLHHPATG